MFGIRLLHPFKKTNNSHYNNWKDFCFKNIFSALIEMMLMRFRIKMDEFCNLTQF